MDHIYYLCQISVRSMQKNIWGYKKLQGGGNKAQGNSREKWKIINNIRGKQNSKIKPSFIIYGTLVEERRAIANGFNKYFTSIASKLNDSHYGLIIEEIPNYTNYIKNYVQSSI